MKKENKRIFYLSIPKVMLCVFLLFLLVSITVGIFVLHVNSEVYKENFWLLIFLFIFASPCFALRIVRQRWGEKNHRLILKSNGLYFFPEWNRPPFYLPWRNIYRISRYKWTKILIEFTLDGIDIPPGITVHQNLSGFYSWILSCAFLSISTKDLFELCTYYHNRRKSKIAKDYEETTHAV